jgi:hypothetical protein
MGKKHIFFLPETTSPFDPMWKIFTFFFLSELFGIGTTKKNKKKVFSQKLQTCLNPSNV